MSLPAAAQLLSDRGPPPHRIVYRSLVALRANPLGAGLEARVAYRFRLFPAQSLAFRDNFLGLGLAPGLTPTYARLGVYAEAQPSTFLGFWAIYEAMQYFGNLNQVQSFPDARVDFSDRARKLAVPGYAAFGTVFTVGMNVNLRFGPIVVRDTLKFSRPDFALHAGDTVFYDVTSDLLTPNRRFTLVNDLDVLYQAPLVGLFVGLRYSAGARSRVWSRSGELLLRFAIARGVLQAELARLTGLNVQAQHRASAASELDRSARAAAAAARVVLEEARPTLEAARALDRQVANAAQTLIPRRDERERLSSIAGSAVTTHAAATADYKARLQERTETATWLETAAVRGPAASRRQDIVVDLTAFAEGETQLAVLERQRKEGGRFAAEAQSATAKADGDLATAGERRAAADVNVATAKRAAPMEGLLENLTSKRELWQQSSRA